MNRKFTSAFLALLFVSLLISATRAQQTAATQQSPENRVELYQALLDLTNPWTVMCIAAHPDDEDGTSLIVMRRKYGAHTVSLFSTFGEGGQNAIGPELYEELGAIRARETMAASEIQGSEPYFLGLKDFGFSKSADETFQKWGHEEALRRMVLQIRKLRPDVIITNHSTTSNDHGHHQATARLTVEAFDAAADPKRFPEQLKNGVEVWQVQRLFVRVRGSQAPPADAPLVTIDPNERDPVRETMFAEQSLAALQKHATQGPWPKSVAQLAARFTNQSDGRLPLTRYRLAREAKGAPALPNNPRNFLDGLQLPESFVKDADVPLIAGKPLVALADDRAKVLDALVKRAAKGYRFTSDSSNFSRLSLIQERIDHATALAAGVNLQVRPSSMIVTPNSNLNLKIVLTNAGSQTLYDQECHSDLPSLKPPVDPSRLSGGPTSIFSTLRELKAGAEFTKDEPVKIPENAAINVPLSSHLYEPSALGLRLVTHCSASIGSLKMNGFKVTSTIPLEVAPPIEITRVTPSPIVFTPQTEKVAKIITLQLVNHGGATVHTSVEALGLISSQKPVPSGFPEAPVTIRPRETREFGIKLPKPRHEMVITRFNPRPEPSPPAPSVRLLLRTTNKSSNEVTVPFVYVHARVDPNLRIGYVRGFDFSLPNALNALGVESKELSVDEVKTSDLSKYSSIIVDNRVYESQPELIGANQKLLDYANAGGNLIVFYHRIDEFNPNPQRNRPQLAPYKLILGNERITDENAPITFLEPQHPLLNVPNKLGPEDFVGWIQERGLYYPKEWDAQFHALLQSNDPGEAPLKGGLLVADHGKGHYIYSSLVWYRQLRAGVPGAYRMLANMISYGREK